MVNPKIACLGPAGSFSENTLVATLGHQPLEIIFVKDLRDLLTELDNHTVDYIWLPWWNSGCGFLQDSLAKEFLLTILHSNNRYKIIADNFTPLKFSLLGIPNTTTKDIKTILVNPYTQAICKQFFIEHPHLNVIVKNSSSEAAKEVADKQDPSIAASANLQSAKLYNLQVLQETMLTHEEESMMHFILLTHQDNQISFSFKNNYYVTSCAVRTNQKSDLLKAINMDIHALRSSCSDSNLQLLELDGQVEEASLREMLGDQLLCYLGCYPRARK